MNDSNDDRAVPVLSGGSDRMDLSHALLLYKTSNPRTLEVTALRATLHRVQHGEIQPGELLTLDQARSISTGLLAEAGRAWTFHDEFVVATGPAGIAWWSPERVVFTHFTADSGLTAAEAKHPPMLWILSGKHLSVWTLMRSERPQLGDQLAQPVQMNVFKSGARVCQGSMIKPSGLDRSAWQSSFDRSAFSWPNDGNDWQTKHPKGTKAFWRDRIDAKGNEPFPYQLLVPADLTVEQAIDRSFVR